ncbi:hypothetical protein ACFTQ7_16500 [Lysinibacillus sp. NPDC056959]|uniref:hypothetical protein n=1 Tax=Lysinibacillus sp. NPDC056959 TaxID=3345981 RepID=UPI00363D848D
MDIAQLIQYPFLSLVPATNASILFYKGISVQYVSERLGNADVDTTIRIYTHLIKELPKRMKKIQ